jgi:hypothetical protein
LLAIPTPRWAIVTAKVVVVATWCGATCLWVIALGFAVGALVVLPGWSAQLAAARLARCSAVAVMIVGLQTTTAFFAGAGRGYILPLAWAAFTIFVAHILSVLGWGAWFPWAVPALLSGVAGPEGESPTLASFVLVGATGFIATSPGGSAPTTRVDGMSAPRRRTTSTGTRWRAVAYRVGYKSEESFSRAFKRKMGSPRMQWRSHAG